MLVSKDINMRIKARALGLPAEDYYNDKMLEDTDLLYTGVAARCRRTSGTKHGKTVESWQQGGHTFYRITGPLVPQPADQPVRVLRGARRAAASTRA